ncbi:uncharacterized protein LAESUDRAFT_327993 [Laetiporus sulphureus 93-53]|uniref:Uncharacterized protein n=1 Tax=Laetiporus sulphureus 93-53 TaxID=1314785 RepID=A0A165CWL8_9APHY|nr:uncharacterized protein LAESUDRAFT_327993 [Laetiporus sulphureus 93-53]KZT03597.1 hypothetical protein LAESUDRAFT_327993 [Laetiporus sulphureus 93-53]
MRRVELITLCYANRSHCTWSRSWMEEEGEVFRKGTVLLGPEEMEGEYDGEELRRELLEAMVERPPPRAVLDDFGAELDPDHASPMSPSTSPQEKKPLPRLYIRRSRSSSNSDSPQAMSSTDKSPDGSAALGVTSPTSPTSPSVQFKAFLSRRTSSASSNSKDAE